MFKLLKYKEAITINRIAILWGTEKGCDWDEAQREAPGVAGSILFL